MYGASIATVPFGYAGGKFLEAFGNTVIKGYQMIVINRAFYAVRRAFPIHVTARQSGVESIVDNLLEFSR